MLMLPPAVRVYVATRPADLRCSFDGLVAAARQWIQVDPFSGHLFVFRNRRADRVKLLFWDRSGFWIFYKRLERGTFRFPPAGDAASVEIEAQELALILEGIDLAGARRRRRWAPQIKASV